MLKRSGGDGSLEGVIRGDGDVFIGGLIHGMREVELLSQRCVGGYLLLGGPVSFLRTSGGTNWAERGSCFGGGASWDGRREGERPEVRGLFRNNLC
jgi:hypothetical protein